MAAGQGLHAGSVGAAYHALLLVGPGRLLVLTLDLEQEAVLTTEGDLVTASSGAGGIFSLFCRSVCQAPPQGGAGVRGEDPGAVAGTAGTCGVCPCLQIDNCLK